MRTPWWPYGDPMMASHPLKRLLEICKQNCWTTSVMETQNNNIADPYHHHTNDKQKQRIDFAWIHRIRNIWLDQSIISSSELWTTMTRHTTPEQKSTIPNFLCSIRLFCFQIASRNESNSSILPEVIELLSKSHSTTQSNLEKSSLYLCLMLKLQAKYVAKTTKVKPPKFS